MHPPTLGHPLLCPGFPSVYYTTVSDLPQNVSWTSPPSGVSVPGTDNRYVLNMMYYDNRGGLNGSNKQVM